MICLWNYRLEKVGLLKCLISPVSEHLFTVNMLKDPEDCLNLPGSILSDFLITLKQIGFEKFVFSSMWNLETVC